MIEILKTIDADDDASFLPDLTTLLDILFILLVFFILTAGAVYKSLDLTLPEGAKEAAIAPSFKDHLMLEIRVNAYALDGEEFPDLTALKEKLLERVSKNGSDNLIIAGDKSAPLERLLPVLTYLQSLGVDTANILMKSETPK
jgi:biopolymer transport protein ExbD